MIRTLAISASALLAAMIAAAPAAACIPIALLCTGGYAECHPTEEQRRERERLASAALTRERTIDARARLRSGKADPAAELAELLVPNIRPIRTELSDCGPIGEVDYGEGRETVDTIFNAVAAETGLSRFQWHEFGDLFTIDHIYPFGASCSAEFRQDFAAELRRRMDQDRLVQAWIFLTAHRGTSDYQRMVMFETRSRAPPVRWIFGDEWVRRQTEGALRRTAWGREISAAADGFWAERGAELGDEMKVCPAAAAKWVIERERLKAEMLRRHAASPGPPHAVR